MQANALILTTRSQNVSSIEDKDRNIASDNFQSVGFQRTSESAYDKFIMHHLQQYGLFTGRENPFMGNLSTVIRSRDAYHLDIPDSNDSAVEEEEHGPGRPYLGQALKTRQLVIDFDGERPIPRLSEPLDLCSIPSPSCPFQGVRWPIECEVIKETINHIEWDPPDPEPFYQPSGHEGTPMPVVEERGNTVYCIDPASKPAFFTCSRVGGSRRPIKSATTYATCQDEHTLVFESRFESGNLQKAVQVGVHEYELTLRTDMYTKKHTQWFYFRVSNMRAGVTYRFTIINLMKSSSLYCFGMRPLLYSERAAREKCVGWHRTGSNIKYYKNDNLAQQDDNVSAKPLYSLTWEFQFPYDSDTCYLTHCYPYTYSRLQRYLRRITSDPSTAAYCTLRVLCRSLAGNTVHVLTVTSPKGDWEERRSKRAVVVTARVHPGETNGSWMMEGFLDFLLGESDDARLLRDTFVFKVVPMLNPDGVVVGNYRCSLAGRDLNRNYKTLLRDSFPCVWYTRNMVKRLLTERDIVLYCDFHGHSRKNNVFMYGCDNREDAALRLHERVFPLMMSKNANDKFSFRSCKFSVQKSKEGTGRIVMWRLGIRNSYTLESTFGGSTLGDRKGTHFTTRDLKSLGYYLCDTLLDYCDPDPTKTSHCLTELSALLRQEFKERLARDVDADGLLSCVSESSTSGSNSTESDGLPVHLLNQMDERSQAKRRRLKTRKERNRLRMVKARITEPKIPQSDIQSTEVDLHNVDQLKAEIQEKIVLKKKTIKTTRTWMPHPTTRIGLIGHVTHWKEDEPVKNEYLEAMRAAYLHCAANSLSTRPPRTMELEGVRRQYRPQHHLSFISSHPPKHRLPVPKIKIMINAIPIQQQSLQFNPDQGYQPVMKGRSPISCAAVDRSTPVVLSLPAVVIPDLGPRNGLEPCSSLSFYPAKTWLSQEKESSAAKDSRPNLIARPLSSGHFTYTAEGSHSLSQVTQEWIRAFPFKGALGQQGTDVFSVPPKGFNRSSGRQSGDQGGSGAHSSVQLKKKPLQGGPESQIPAGDALEASRFASYNPRRTQIEEEDGLGAFPRMFLATVHSQTEVSPAHHDSLCRPQNLSLVKGPRLATTVRKTETRALMENKPKGGLKTRPSGYGPSQSPAP